MKKLTLGFIFALFAAFPVSLMAENYQQLVLTLTDKTTQTFWLDDEPAVTFGATDLTVTTKSTTYTVARNQVNTFTFTEASAEGINLVGTITSTGMNRLFDLNGRMLQEGEINTSNLPAGNYVLRTANGKSVKILKK